MCAEPCFVNAVGKRTVSIVVIKVGNIVTEVGFGNVYKSVFIVIRNRNSHSGLFLTCVAQRNTGRDAHFLEGSISQVVVEQAGTRVTGHIQIWVTVIIEVGSKRCEAVAAFWLADATGN